MSPTRRLAWSVLLIGATAGLWFASRPSGPAAGATDPSGASPVAAARDVASRAGTGGGAGVAASLSADEKRARVERIKRDYDEVRTRAAADYAAAAGSFPGGLNAFLRQLALLEREKRADLATVLTPADLDELELAETNAGQTVRRALTGTGATEAQVRTVFRLEREFEDRFALVFDLSPAALLERQRVRDEYDEKVFGVLEPADALTWLAARDGDQGLMNAWVRERGLPPGVGLELWRIKAGFVRRRLELKTAEKPSPLALAELIRETERRLATAAGAEAPSRDRDGAFRWLPRP